MTPELLAKIESSLTMSELEDIYLPFRPKTAYPGHNCTGKRDWNLWLRS